MNRWHLPSIDQTGKREPRVLFSSPACRAVVIDLQAGESMGEHSVHENAIVQVATGKVVYGPERLQQDSYSASPVIADGRIYVTSENTGLTSVFSTGEKFEILAQNPLNDYTLSSPAISEGQIFIRTTGHLWAIGKRQASK